MVMMNNTLFFEMEWKTVLIILGVVVLAILLIYLLLTKVRFKRGAKKAGRQLSVKYSTTAPKSKSLLFIDMINDVC